MAVRLDDLIERATNAQLSSEPDMAIDLEICDRVRDPTSAHSVVKMIRKKLHDKHYERVYLALCLVEVCMRRCGRVVHQEVATDKFMKAMRSLVKSKDGSTGMKGRVEDKVLDLIRSWAKSFDVRMFPIFQSILHDLTKKGFKFPPEEATPNATSTGTTNSQVPTTEAENAIQALKEQLLVLQEMLNAIHVGKRPGEDEIVREVLSYVRKGKPMLERAIEKETDDTVLGSLLSLNDAIQEALERYERMEQGDRSAYSSQGSGRRASLKTGSQSRRSLDKATLPQRNLPLTPFMGSAIPVSSSDSFFHEPRKNPISSSTKIPPLSPPDHSPVHSRGRTTGSSLVASGPSSSSPHAPERSAPSTVVNDLLGLNDSNAPVALPPVQNSNTVEDEFDLLALRSTRKPAPARPAASAPMEPSLNFVDLLSQPSAVPVPPVTGFPPTVSSPFSHPPLSSPSASVLPTQYSPLHPAAAFSTLSPVTPVTTNPFDGDETSPIPVSQPLPHASFAPAGPAPVPSNLNPFLEDSVAPPTPFAPLTPPTTHLPPRTLNPFDEEDPTPNVRGDKHSLLVYQAGFTGTPIGVEATGSAASVRRGPPPAAPDPFAELAKY